MLQVLNIPGAVLSAQYSVKYSAKNGFQTNTHMLCYKLRKQHHSLNWFTQGIKDDYNTQF